MEALRMLLGVFCGLVFFALAAAGVWVLVAWNAKDGVDVCVGCMSFICLIAGGLTIGATLKL